MATDTLGTRLREARRNKGWSQLFVSERAKIPNTTLSNYERDFRTPDLATLSQLADLYGVSMEYLAGTHRDTQLALVQSERVAIEGRFQSYTAPLNDVSIIMIPQLDTSTHDWSIDLKFRLRYVPATKTMLKGSSTGVGSEGSQLQPRISDYYCIQVPDDGLTGDGIRKDAVVVVRDAYPEPLRGEVCVVKTKYGTVVRRVISHSDYVILISSNSEFPPQVLEQSEQWTVMGEVIQVIWSVGN